MQTLLRVFHNTPGACRVHVDAGTEIYVLPPPPSPEDKAVLDASDAFLLNDNQFRDPPPFENDPVRVTWRRAVIARRAKIRHDAMSPADRLAEAAKKMREDALHYYPPALQSSAFHQLGEAITEYERTKK